MMYPLVSELAVAGIPVALSVGNSSARAASTNASTSGISAAVTA